MRKKNLSLSNLVLVAALAAVTAQADSVSQQVQSSLKQLNGNYQQFLNFTPSNVANDGDIMLSCEQSLYVDWGNAYLNVLASTPNLTESAIGQPVDDFGDNLYRAKNDLELYEFGRPGITKAVTEQLNVQRKTLVLMDVDPTKMSPDESEAPLFMSNLQICGSLAFINAVANAAPLNPSQGGFPPGTFSGDTWVVTWVPSPKGGIVPVMGPPSTPTPSGGNGCNGQPGCSGLVGGVITGGMLTPINDYQSFLNAVKAKQEIHRGN